MLEDDVHVVDDAARVCQCRAQPITGQALPKLPQMREAVEFQRLLHMGQQRGQQLALALGAMRIRAGAKQREPARVKSARVQHPADEEVRLLEAPAVVAQRPLMPATEPGPRFEGQRLAGMHGDGLRRRVQVLDLFIGLQHFGWLPMKVDGVDIDAGRRHGGRAPHGRGEGQHGFEQVQRLVLEMFDRLLVR